MNTAYLIGKAQKALIDHGYVVNRKEGSRTIPATKCPKCGKVSVITGVKDEDKKRSVIDICYHAENASVPCNYYFKIEFAKGNLMRPKFGPLSALILAFMKKNAGKYNRYTNHPALVDAPPSNPVDAATKGMIQAAKNAGTPAGV